MSNENESSPRIADSLETKDNRLNPVIEAYVAAGNAGDVEAFLACFEAGAVVVDEAQTHRGLEEIRQWFHQTRAEYQFKSTPIRFHEEDGGWVVTSTVSGTFPGSPVDLSYRFTLKEGKIATLTIE